MVQDMARAGSGTRKQRGVIMGIKEDVRAMVKQIVESLYGRG